MKKYRKPKMTLRGYIHAYKFPEAEAQRRILKALKHAEDLAKEITIYFLAKTTAW